MATLNSSGELSIWYHGKSSADVGLRMMTPLTVGVPERQLVQVQLPYTSKIIELTSYYGKAVFNERQITVTFWYDFKDSLSAGQDMYTKIQRWLYNIQGKSPLVLPTDRKYYYMAEVVSASTREDALSAGKFTVVFNAYPFKMSVNYTNDDNWNRFMFETDHVQQIAYKFKTGKTIHLFNDSVNAIVPTVVASSPITIRDDVGNEYNFDAGISTQEESLFPLSLNVGENDLTIVGLSEPVTRCAILIRDEVI